MPEGQRLAAANAKWTGIKGTAAAESYEKQARERAAEMQQSQTQPAASSETSKQLGRKACRKLMKMVCTYYLFAVESNGCWEDRFVFTWYSFTSWKLKLLVFHEFT